jgi:endonuclease/exonuclease/phosphatase family metal-dependent hydrolase
MNIRVPRFPVSFSTALLAVVAFIPLSARPASAQDVVLHSSDFASISGNWAPVDSYSGADNRKIQSNDYGWSSIDAPSDSPSEYFEATFNARAWVGYRVWLRLKASGNSKWNDSVWVQFSDSMVSGEPTYRIGSTSGLLVNLEECGGCGVSNWGWSGHAWWLSQPLVVEFPSDGAHTIRIQTREDGVEIDQIVLSSSTYMNRAPGNSRDDSTILARSSDGAATEQVAAAPSPEPQPAPETPAREPDPTPAAPEQYSGGGGRFRMATWNINFGGGDPWGQAQAIANSGADVVVLQEAQTFDENMPATYPDRLRQLTGQTWYSVWAGAADCSGGCQGALILSRLPILDTSIVNLSGMATPRALINVGGVAVNVFDVHLEYYDTGLRSAQLQQFMEWSRNFGGPRIVGGDFNSWWGEWWIGQMESEYSDTWQDTTGSDENGYTLNGTVRFDYLFRAHDQNWRLTPTGCWTRWGSSDHAMVIADYQVQ